MVRYGLWHLSLDVILAEIVPFKQLLDTVSAQLSLTFFYSFGIFPFLIVNMICVEIVNFNVRDVLWLHATASQRIPIEVSKPGVRFKLSRTLHVTDAIHWLPLQTLIYKVCRFLIPAFSYAILLDLNLAGEDLISDILASSSFIGSFTHHTFVRNDTNSEVVSGQAMILSAHDFRCHVTWRTTSLSGIVWRQNACYTKVGQPQITFIIKY